MPSKIHASVEEETYTWAETIAASMGWSMNQYINHLIKQDVKKLTDDEKKFLQGFRAKMQQQAQGSDDTGDSDERPSIRKRKV